MNEHKIWTTRSRRGNACNCHLNHDHKLTPAYAAIALRIAAGSHPFDDAADVSGDHRVTSLDALMILQAAAGAITL